MFITNKQQQTTKMSKLIIMGQRMKIGTEDQLRQKMYVIEKGSITHTFHDYDIWCPVRYITESPSEKSKEWLKQRQDSMKSASPILLSKHKTTVEQWFYDPAFHVDRYCFYRCSFYLIGDDTYRELGKLCAKPSVPLDYDQKMKLYANIQHLLTKAEKSMLDKQLEFRKAKGMVKLTKKMLSL